MVEFFYFCRMAKKWRVQDKNRLQQIITTYTKRRIINKQRGIPTKYLSTRLYDYRRSLKTIENHELKVRLMSERVEEFTGIQIRNSVNNRKRKAGIARCLFCKILLESGVPQCYITWWVNYSQRGIPNRTRRKFQKSFLTNKKNLETWNRFKQFVKEKEDENK